MLMIFDMVIIKYKSCKFSKTGMVLCSSTVAISAVMGTASSFTSWISLPKMLEDSSINDSLLSSSIALKEQPQKRSFLKRFFFFKAEVESQKHKNLKYYLEINKQTNFSSFALSTRKKQLVVNEKHCLTNAAFSFSKNIFRIRR